MTYIWLGIIILAIIAEAATVQMVAIWFAPAALVSLISLYLGAPVWLQVALFLITAALCIAFLYRKLKKNISKGYTKTNIDAVIGSKAVAEVDIPGGGIGRVKVRGISWQACSEVDVQKGDTVKVLSVDGVTLICEPLADKETAEK